MIDGGFEAFAGRRILLLQGPVGPFFARLARDLKAAGAEVWKINFNAGDCLFYPDGEAYRDTMEAWPDWLELRLAEWRIDLVFLIGDFRPIHSAVIPAIKQRGIELGVFEEGYIRPDFITLERGGVNGQSPLPRDPEAYRAMPDRVIETRTMPRTFWPMVLWGFLYYAASSFMPWPFRHYRHHRPLNLTETRPWILSPLRKAWFGWRERDMTRRLTHDLDKAYFLAPLQVHNDAQVLHHADVGGVEGFITATIASFAQHAPQDRTLVFKHHPMDRGYRDYTRLIRSEAAAAGCAGRVLYIHDQYLPTLIRHCCGMVVINSTVGLSAVGMQCPTKALGHAIWDMPGLTYQGSLASFWTDAESGAPDAAFWRKYREELIAATQINGSFYRKLAPEVSATGLIWKAGPPSLAGAPRPVRA